MKYALIITGILSLVITTSFCQDSSKTGCSILKNGRFRYIDAEDSTAFIVMKDGMQTDGSEKNDFIIESSVTWTGDCSYKLKMTKITMPDFPFKPGDTMNVDIDKIEDDIIYYTANVKGNSFKGRFKKISD